MQVMLKKQREVSLCADLRERLEALSQKLAEVTGDCEGPELVDVLFYLASVHAERMSYELLLSELSG